MGPGDLNQALSGLPCIADPNVLRGLDTQDNAGVYRISADVALVQTVDFFTPVVDDPYTFGQIAVANALSDVYAMAGKPVTAMNIVCFPLETLGIPVLTSILRGGAEKMAEAGVVLIGGHSVDDPELKYGLAVTGTVHPERLVTNGGAKAGDSLILTKPLGTGIIATALKAGKADERSVTAITLSMAALNRKASEIMQEVGVNACTDITGFGFLGHASQMARNSQVGIRISAAALPVFPGTADLARQGFQPGGLRRNREYYASSVRVAGKLPPRMDDILYDPQTSGGLLISVAPGRGHRLLELLRQNGIQDACLVGDVLSGPKGAVIVEP